MKWNVMALITVEANSQREATDKAEDVAAFCNARGPVDAVTPVDIEVIDDVGGFYCPEPVDEIPGNVYVQPTDDK